MKSSLELSNIIVLVFATVRYMMILDSLKIPERVLVPIKKTESDWLKMFLAKAGMFFDCPVCSSLVAGLIAVLVNSLNHTLNLIVALSALGFLAKKYLVDR